MPQQEVGRERCNEAEETQDEDAQARGDQHYIQRSWEEQTTCEVHDTICGQAQGEQDGMPRAYGELRAGRRV